VSGALVAHIDFTAGRRFEVAIHDLLYEQTDCIVNAANGRLAHGGGVAAAISKAAGLQMDQECDAWIAEHGQVPTGGAVATTAGKLRFKGIIHAVGPMMGQGDEENKITEALRTSFQIAHKEQWRSLSFPGISSGIFSVPHQICARAYLNAVRGFFEDYEDSPLRLIRLCLFKGPLVDAVEQAMAQDK